MTVIQYNPPGQVAAEFHNSMADVRGIKGPVGSGKSSTCCMEIVKHSLKQTPHNGWRKARWAVIRNTYPELKSTTIKTWQTWFNDELAPIRWDAPITAHMKIKDCGDADAIEGAAKCKRSTANKRLPCITLPKMPVVMDVGIG